MAGSERFSGASTVTTSIRSASMLSRTAPNSTVLPTPRNP